MMTIPQARDTDTTTAISGNAVDYQELLWICLPACIAAVIITNLLAFVSPNIVETNSVWFNWVYLLIAVAPGIFLLTKRGYCWSLFGIKRAGAAQAAMEAGLLVMPIVGIGLLAAVIVCGSNITTLAIAKLNIGPAIALYFFHVCLQEFLARGFQTVLQHTLQDHKGYVSVAGAGVMFGLFHLHFSLIAMLLTFVLGVFLGLVYLRQRNLIGVTLIHFVIGVMSISLPIW